MAKRDVHWDTWTCVLGWPMQGAWSSKLDRGVVHDNVDKTMSGFMSSNLRKDRSWLNDIRKGNHGYGKYFKRRSGTRLEHCSYRESDFY